MLDLGINVYYLGTHLCGREVSVEDKDLADFVFVLMAGEYSGVLSRNLTCKECNKKLPATHIKITAFCGPGSEEEMDTFEIAKYGELKAEN